MAIDYGKDLVSAVDVSSTQGTLYLVPSSLNRVVGTHALLVNHAAGAESVTLWVVAAGDATASRHIVLPAKSLGPGETYLVKELVGRAIIKGGEVEGECSAGSSISFSFTGNEVTT